MGGTGAKLVKHTLVFFVLGFMLGSGWIQSPLEFLPSIFMCTAFFLLVSAREHLVRVDL